MDDRDLELPQSLQTHLDQETWHTWDVQQKRYILNHQGQSITSKNLQPPDLSQPCGEYSGKHWQLGLTRPDLQESCPKCGFSHCFYAQPRNWSMGATSDVWNLMKCANVNCQTYFESCL